jgi:hypothetical protein
MYCANCGNIIVGTGLTCTNCGAPLTSAFSVKPRLTNQKYILTGETTVTTDAVKAEETEYITIREREKRIIEERIKKDIDAARMERERIETERINNQSDGVQQAEMKRIIGEKIITGTPDQVKKKAKISSTKKFLITTGTFVTGFFVFIMCMGYLFWRFAPPGDNYKHEFVDWMSENANSSVNDFLFNDMKLNKYYTPSHGVDYSGTYVNRIASGPERIYLDFRNGALTGRYYKNGYYFRLTGYTGNKGEFSLTETFNGKTTATITGKLFPTGYLTAERNEPTGKKDILSMEKQ